MRKNSWSLAVALCLGLCTAALRPQGQLTARAKEPHERQADGRTSAQEPVSRGNMIYWDGDEKAGIYTADILLLQEKLAGISGEIFDPAGYAHADGAGDRTWVEYDLDDVFVEEEPETVEVPVMTAGETEQGEPTEITEENDLSEILEEETEEPEILEEETGDMEEPEMTETKEPPMESVSGNDCTVEEEQARMEEITEETASEEGEKQ